MSVLGQLGNRVQHALRAFTPLDQKAVKVAAQTFRANPAFDTEEAITQLQTGEALVSFLDEKGPQRGDPLPDFASTELYGTHRSALRKAFIETSPCYGLYDQPVDRQSAYEYLAGVVAGGKAAVAPQPYTAPQPYEAPQPYPTAAAPVFTPAPTVAPSATFMVLDPATGQYVQKPLTAMATDANQGVPAAPVAPAAPAAPVAASSVLQQNVLVLDPTTGQYVQKQMNLQLDPTTGQYVPVISEEERKAAQKAQKEAETADAKAAREAQKAEKERIAEERRQKADALRDERAERARANDSILGRVKNTAINQVTRTITNELTRGLMGTILGKKR